VPEGDTAMRKGLDSVSIENICTKEACHKSVCASANLLDYILFSVGAKAGS